jgi:diaminopimelate epimerase
MHFSPKNFWKYHGRGNDFVLIDDQNKTFPLEEKTISHMCHRRLGIGADGLILLQKSSKADFRMRIFNSDGKEAKSCGNGLLCLLTFLQDQNLFSQKSLSIETFDRIVYGIKEKNGFSIEMGEPLGLKMNQDLVIDGQKITLHQVNTGVDHAVVFVENIKEALVEKLGKKIRYLKEFSPDGVNVNFVEKKNDDYHVRTYERGVEAETLSCGTGACAVGTVANKLYGEKECQISFQEGGLFIQLENNKIFMKGSATFVFSGSFSS